MELSPFQIAKKISQALKHKHIYEERQKALNHDPVVGLSSDQLAKAVFNGESYRIDKLVLDGVSEQDLEKLRQAVNNAFDRFDNYWKDLE